MEMQFAFDEMTTSLVSPAYVSSEEEEMDVDLLSVSVEGTGRHSDDSDIEVIACYRHVPVTQPNMIAPRKMTTDLSGCADDGFPDFPWEDDLENLWPEEFQSTKVELATGPNALGQENNCPISQCSNLVPLVDTPLSPPPSEQGPSHARYDYAGQYNTNFTAPLNAHIQGISVRFGAHCGGPNAAVYGDCIVCGRSYEQIRESAVLAYLESISTRNESYQERQRRRNAYLEGMNQGTVLLVPRGVSQAAACDGNYYQIPEECVESNPQPGVLPI